MPPLNEHSRQNKLEYMLQMVLRNGIALRALSFSQG